MVFLNNSFCWSTPHLISYSVFFANTAFYLLIDALSPSFHNVAVACIKATFQPKDKGVGP
jgi:hypothetical protein